MVPEKGHVDLSLRRVNSAQRDKVLKENKYANKFENLLQFLTEAEGVDMTLEQAYEMVGWPIKDHFNDYQEAVEVLKEDEIESIKTSANNWSGIRGIVKSVEYRHDDNDFYIEICIRCENISLVS